MADVKRFARLAGSLLYLLLPCSAAYSAALNPPYFVIEPAEKVTATDKIEVAEVFSYACSHCAEFQTLVDAWRKRLNAKTVEFVYVPAPYDQRDVWLARGFVAAGVLGAVEKTHHGMFQAIHEKHASLRSFDDVVSLYGQLGVPVDKFKKAANDFFVDSEVKRIYNLMVKYKIDGTPTLIVAGKYRITAESAGNQAAMIQVADQLIGQLTQSTATSRQAPKSGK